MQENNSEIEQSILQEISPIIKDVANKISDFGTKSGQKAAEWIDIIIDSIF